MTLKSQNFDVHQGSGVLLQFTCTDPQGNIVDLTGLSANQIRWQLAQDANSTPIISKSIGAGITIVNPAAGRFDVAVLPADTVSLQPIKYYHEAKLTDQYNNKSTLAYGTAQVLNALITD